MAIEFHNPDDSCVPFPHRIISPGPVIRDDVRMIICAICDHWILTRRTDCECETKCHAIGELLASLPIIT